MSVLTKEQSAAHAIIPEIKACYREHVKAGRDFMKNAIEIGRLLIKMKELLPHGEFTPLIEERFEFGITQARNYMTVAGYVPKLPAEVDPEEMSIKGLLRLASEAKPKTTPGGVLPASTSRSTTAANSAAVSPQAVATPTVSVVDQSVDTASTSDDPIGDTCQHEWDEDGDCIKCKMPREVSRPSGGTTFNPDEWEGDAKDGTGKEHSGDMGTVFKTAADFDAARQHLINLKKALNRLKTLRGGEMLQVAGQRIMTDLDNLDTEIKFAKPFAPCCYCKGKPKDCKACKGMGWLTETAHNAAPKEKKRAQT